MIRALLRLRLAAFLIVTASAILLLTEHERPRPGAGASAGGPAAREKVRSIALFQHVSQATIEEGARGVLAGLAEAGYQDGETIHVRRYNAEGDAATSAAIARAIIGGDDELIITLSTPSLRSIAGANRDAKRLHVFGMVADPVGAGVGIGRDDPRKHLPYMVGLGTMPPVAETFRLARRIAPRLARVGVAWNPSESNSEATTRLARAVCRELGIELLEANVDGSAAVRESVAALVGRGAEAIWVGGDNTVLTSLDAAIGPARAAGVPVFTSIPGSAARGALFDLGADYDRIGREVAKLAGRVLNGESPADMPILYEVPPETWINRVAMQDLRGGWSFPPDVDSGADVVVEKGGPVRRRPRVEFATQAPAPSRPSRTWKVALAGYSETPIMEDVVAGIQRGIQDAGLLRGQDYTTTYRNAQGDIATLSALMDELNGGEADLVVSISTPALQAALRKVEGKPVVFAGVLDPIAAGAGASNTDHRPNVTGAYLDYPYAAMARAVREVMPQARRVGTLFSPGEINSTLARRRFEEILRGEGLELISLPANGPSEVGDAALGLCQSGVDVICQLADNLSNSTFPAIVRACEMARTPLFTFSPTLVTKGAVLGVGVDFAENGRDAGRIVARVIRGEDPSRLPFRATTKVRRSVNLDNARRIGLSIPTGWIKAADDVIPGRAGSR